MDIGSLLTENDIYLFREGSHFRLYDKLGSHLVTVDGVSGAYFAVWAPNAEGVTVMGKFNGWNPDSHSLALRMDGSGIWEGFIPGIAHGAPYKYHIRSRYRHYRVDKGDPYAFRWEPAPETASVVWDLKYAWGDGEWMKNRAGANAFNAPMSIYEVHLGSWRRVPEEDGRFLTYREMAESLADYVEKMGFTHVEFLPVMEHPFYGSWGYQIVGFFAPSSRFGTPQDFMAMVDYLHQRGIGVILDWVPSHFPDNIQGLVFFDGTHLYEHADPRKGFHPEWKSYIFNYGRQEVRAFLISAALFWFDKYHIDGLRVDAVASMLYLDYARKWGEWIPNEFGGKENIEAISFIKRLNEAIYSAYPDVQTIAEESTAWPMVSRPTYIGGLGFGLKWNMGWMHDTLSYFSKDAVYRKYHQGQLTFSIWYAFWENFVLPLSHDEVVYGKGSLIGKMPGDDWQKFANLRLLFGYMYGHPGKKLLFMGGEFAQWREWNHDLSLDWHLLEYFPHQGVQKWVADLNRMYATEPALHELDFSSEGFEWVDFHDAESSVISFIRKGKTTGDLIMAVCNFTPVPRENYRLGVPWSGIWKEILNSDARVYGGSGHGNFGQVEATPLPAHGKSCSLSLLLPPLGIIFLKGEESEKFQL
ncbi:MAG: 1,4-alpha-glucan branching protein GlgB [bacterium]